MRLHYTLGTEIINLLTSIAEKKGEIKAYFLNQLEPLSREKNKKGSVHATISLQESSLTREATNDILNDLALNAPLKMIRQVKRTMKVYEKLSSYNPLSQESLKAAYQDLLEEPGTQASYRKNAVHFYYWSGFIGQSVSYEEMRKGMKELFHYLRHGKDPMLIKCCLCHYAIQFYQPFEYENEVLSRLWQTLLLIKEHSAFEYLSWEKEILSDKKNYHMRLPGRDQKTDVSDFMIYMLGIIDQALISLLESCRKSVRPMDRIRYFYTLHPTNFTRKDYMLIHKNISKATASRDLDLGVARGFFEKHGSNNQSMYSCHLLYE